MKLHYLTDLSEPPKSKETCADIVVCQLEDFSSKALAEAFFDAYLNTIDYEGETIDDAEAEINNVFAGEYGKFIANLSSCIVENGKVLSALFVTSSEPGKLFIPYVITVKEAQGKGLATLLLNRFLTLAPKNGWKVAELFVTKGNSNAIKIYE